ncbi:unnamed protein product [Prunus brigantina]
MKMEFPRFCDGDDPLGWIFYVPDAQKVKLASFHMEREALQWFQWLDCIHRYPRWEDFTKALCQEFGFSDLEDYAESLLKLKQTGSLRDYISEFRRLASSTRDMNPSILRSCFIGGLKKELRYDVKLLRPILVQDACALALQLNAKFLDLKPTVPFRHTLPISIHSFQPKVELPVKKLTPYEIQFHRQRNLCFHCDEKYTRGHVCSKKQLLLINVDFDTPALEDVDEEVDQQLHQVEVIACALFGTLAPRSIKAVKVQGFIKHCPVIILLDYGNSHNFIDATLVKRLG